jgi:metallophosphoesterase (TIGR03768 family)
MNQQQKENRRMKTIYSMKSGVSGTKRIILGLAMASTMIFLRTDAFAAPVGTSTLQFNFVSAMTNPGVEPGAGGAVNGKLDRQGNANSLRLKISLARLNPNAAYQLIAYLNDDTYPTPVTGFTTSSKGAFAVTYVQAKANAKSTGNLLPNALNPICGVRELAVLNGIGQTVMRADLMNPDSLQYRLKRILNNTGFVPAATGALQIKANKQSTQFRLQVSGLTPNTDYLLAINGSVAQSSLTDSAGKLDLTTLPPGSADAFDINTLTLSDSFGSNVVLTTDGSGPVVTTRQQTIRPLAIPSGTMQIQPKDVSLYSLYGYSAWQVGPAEDEGAKTNLMQTGYLAATNTARLLSFFSMSDIHITDKESPAEVLWFGWNAPFSTTPGLFSQAYSPVCLSTPQVLDVAVKTVNALHRQTPFDFGICLGDAANSSQYNELRWFIDVMDGKYITPSSGDHLGADIIGYQKPFQAAGLDRSIRWYEAIGNHDQFFMGTELVTDKIRAAQVGTAVLNMDPNALDPNASEGLGMYVGVVDGTTRYGEVIKGGPTNTFASPPTVAADTNRLSITTAASSTATYIDEFFKSPSSPAGHGFNRTNTGSTAACYSFVPVTNMPVKVIVLDDTCKTSNPSAGPQFYGSGWMDAQRMAWLTNELQMGQDSNQLMILACHIPINPQQDLFNTTPNPQFYDYQTETNLLATLHRYPNLILVMAGHRHLNTVTPQPSPDPAHPEYGFWEVETPSLRDFPRQFRTFDILRNSDNTISIVTTDVDPQVQPGSVADDSLGYAVGAYRLFGNTTLGDTTSHAYNAELIKQLSPAMQTNIAGYGGPLDYRAVCSSIASRLEQ